MFGRIVSLVQTAAIIACPMWCSSGLIHAAQCCTAEQSVAKAACTSGQTAACCCSETSRDNDDRRGRGQCPLKSCQGVCGGAVFEKPVELDDGWGSASCPLVEVEASFRLQLAECRMLDITVPRYCDAGNHGRFVRTLHSSFLC